MCGRPFETRACGFAQRQNIRGFVRARVFIVTPQTCRWYTSWSVHCICVHALSSEYNQNTVHCDVARAAAAKHCCRPAEPARQRLDWTGSPRTTQRAALCSSTKGDAGVAAHPHTIYEHVISSFVLFMVLTTLEHRRWHSDYTAFFSKRPEGVSFSSARTCGDIAAIRNGEILFGQELHFLR